MRGKERIRYQSTHSADALLIFTFEFSRSLLAVNVVIYRLRLNGHWFFQPHSHPFFRVSLPLPPSPFLERLSTSPRHDLLLVREARESIGKWESRTPQLPIRFTPIPSRGPDVPLKSDEEREQGNEEWTFRSFICTSIRRITNFLLANLRYLIYASFIWFDIYRGIPCVRETHINNYLSRRPLFYIRWAFPIQPHLMK